MRRRFVLIALSLALASCGDDGSGSGSGGGGGGVTVNQPPVFTSGTAVTVPENTAGTVYTATANDPEGKAVTYTISGGADAARFTINASGAVSFITPPDFEHPTDSDANNTYLITVSASDGVNTVAQNVTITVSDVPGEGIQVRQFTRVDANPIQMATIPGDRRFAVLTHDFLWLVDSVTGANSIAMRPGLGRIGLTGCGILIRSMAFSPNFAADRTMYVSGPVDCDRSRLEIRRVQVDANGAATGPGTRVLVATVNFYDAATDEASVDDMRFGPDGLLYVTTGDRSNNFGKTPGPAQSGYTRDLSNLAGKVLRIDVNGDDFPADPDRNYRIPAGNPFAAGGGAPEVFAYGFHIPRGIDFNGNDMLFADRGYGDVTLAPNPVHEIDLVRRADAGGDYGFYNCQGDRNFSGTGPCTFPTILPVIQASAPVASEGRYLIGGIVYDGPIQDLRGQYIFAFAAPGGGYPNSFWSVPVAQLTQGANLKFSTLRDRTADFQAVGGVLNSVAAMGKDLSGNAYIFDSDGDIFVIAPPA